MPSATPLAGHPTVIPIPILSDNYAWRLVDPASGAVAVVDPADADAVIAALESPELEQGRGRLDLVLLTHHHSDHIAGAEQVARHFGARMVGAAQDAARLPPLDLAVSPGDHVRLGEWVGEVIDTPGHTRGHISYFFPASGGSPPILFCADTLFSLGCGRLLEGTASEMFSSLQRLARLPDDTLVCCGHEYTESNARFAMSLGNASAALNERVREVTGLRRAGTPTVPVRLGLERATNPFLIADDVSTLAALRSRKDSYR
ncbi:hydroxyacylglutathione hydrolase [Lichenicola sp.]|uniref:hydroxyacylglutathione hydrolase n=1 Tax=Lichenicola sp. TaxID=2804529 RepID=UPI003AFF6A31